MKRSVLERLLMLGREEYRDNERSVLERLLMLGREEYLDSEEECAGKTADVREGRVSRQ